MKYFQLSSSFSLFRRIQGDAELFDQMPLTQLAIQKMPFEPSLSGNNDLI